MNPNALKYGLCRPRLEAIGYMGWIPGTPEFKEAVARGEKPLREHIALVEAVGVEAAKLQSAARYAEVVAVEN